MHAYFAGNVNPLNSLSLSLDSLVPMRGWYKTVAHCSLSFQNMKYCVQHFPAFDSLWTDLNFIFPNLGRLSYAETGDDDL